MRQRYARTLRRAAVLVAALALTWGFAPSAMAGGPTSVLIASPESEETAALYYTDKEYAELTRQLGALEEPAPKAPGQKERPRSLDGALGSRQINVTWMLHDVRPWRVDRVYTSADLSTIWIATLPQPSPRQEVSWHRAEQPAALRALLKKLGLMGEKTGAGLSGGMAPPPAVEAGGSAAGAAGPDVPAREREEATASAAADDSAVWWWAAGALGAGTAIGLVLRPLAGRLPRPPFGGRGGPGTGGPRQQLLDV
ncbi:hypothetical protein [Streptomyces sp. AK02-01A]|uniref:hypothetical protein n=1 Tax=Streptomyces sp. AK02-01A TaxID=3028648 RepID=UPI0029A4A281|nr:hypothetical protein [Streptomyces sp. AK02-01A]MDX3852259.1 hypothetical protein [Streptomyces sp. AK02-01A]